MERPRLCGTCRHAEPTAGLRRCSLVVSESPALRKVLARVAVVAKTSSSVVIHGETGTGKEVIAKLLHSNGPRKTKPFVAVNVAALPSELLESELFGHVRGSFTGATATTPGLFGEADGGTIFLDEIGELPLPLQAKLLRVLQEGEIRRVGEPKARPVDVRVVSATHRDLADLVAKGRFREDLYYRLRVFSLVVPPLRERPADVMPLASMFAARLGVPGLVFTRAARRILERYRWPGNVRELGNVVEQAAAFAEGGVVDVDQRPEELRGAPPSNPSADSPLVSLAEIERRHIARVLAACAQSHGEAAKILGISRTTLWRKLSAAP